MQREAPAGGQELGSRDKEGCLGWEGRWEGGHGNRERDHPVPTRSAALFSRLSQPFDDLLIPYNISLALKSTLILMQLLISFLSVLAGNFLFFPCKGSVSLCKRVLTENVSAHTERHLSLPDQGSSPHPLLWKHGGSTTDRQGSPLKRLSYRPK